MKAIIVDDEPRAIELLKNYLEYFNHIHLVSTFRNGLKAFEFMSKNEIDLIFLDINMPNISGISLSKMISPKTKIIFTTAYSDYAVESYEVQAVDYLLKPISLERFTKAISKVISQTEKAISEKPNDDDVILVKSGSETHRIKPNHVIYIEKDGNYSTYFLAERKIVTRQSMAELIENLNENFVRTHKSFLVNINHIISFDKFHIKTKLREIPIGASYKDSAMEKIYKND